MGAIMTPEAAIYSFLTRFDLPVYASTSVPSAGDDNIQFPYMTYDLTVGSWGDGDVQIPVNLWYRTDSESVPNAKVREMRENIGLGGVTVPCDDGMLWIKRGNPFSQSLRIEGEDVGIKRRYILLDVEFMTS